MKTSIATVSISGDFAEKLVGDRRRRFRRRRDLRERFSRLRRLARARSGAWSRDAGLEITLFQPFRDFEGLPEPQRSRAFDRAERKFDVMQELGTDLMLVCSNVSPVSLGGIDRAAADFRELGERAAQRAACASATRRWPGAGTSTIIATPGRSCGAPIIPTSA